MEVVEVIKQDTHAIIGNRSNVESFGTANTAEFYEVLSSTLYSNGHLAAFREVMSNAWDAHIASGKTDVAVEVTITDTEVIIRDYGPGIPHDKIRDIYCIYGGSTKTYVDSQTGGFGLGSKAPFAYTKNFSIANYNNGVKAIFNISRGSAETKGIPDCQMVVQVPCEETGLEVNIPLNTREDAPKFKEMISYLCRFGGIFARVNGRKIERVNYDEPVFKNMVIVNKSTLPPWLRGNSCIAFIKYGSVVYPLDMSSIPQTDLFLKFGKSTTSNRGHGRQNLFEMLAMVPIFVAPPSSLTIMPSREGLKYSDKTLETLTQLFQDFQDDFNEFGKEVFPALYSTIEKKHCLNLLQDIRDNTTSINTFITKFDKVKDERFFQNILVDWFANSYRYHNQYDVNLQNYDPNDVTIPFEGVRGSLFRAMVKAALELGWYNNEICQNLNERPGFIKEVRREILTAVSQRSGNKNILRAFLRQNRENKRKYIPLKFNYETMLHRYENNIAKKNVRTFFKRIHRLEKLLSAECYIYRKDSGSFTRIDTYSAEGYSAKTFEAMVFNVESSSVYVGNTITDIEKYLRRLENNHMTRYGFQIFFVTRKEKQISKQFLGTIQKYLNSKKSESIYDTLDFPLAREGITYTPSVLKRVLPDTKDKYNKYQSFEDAFVDEVVDSYDDAPKYYIPAWRSRLTNNMAPTRPGWNLVNNSATSKAVFEMISYIYGNPIVGLNQEHMQQLNKAGYVNVLEDIAREATEWFLEPENKMLLLSRLKIIAPRFNSVSEFTIFNYLTLNQVYEALNKPLDEQIVFEEDFNVFPATVMCFLSLANSGFPERNGMFAISEAARRIGDYVQEQFEDLKSLSRDEDLNSFFRLIVENGILKEGEDFDDDYPSRVRKHNKRINSPIVAAAIMAAIQQSTVQRNLKGKNE